MSIVGFDLSSVATGVTKLNDRGKVEEHFTLSFKGDTYQRLIKTTNAIKDWLPMDIELVILEDVYGIRRNTQCLLELRGMIIYILTEQCIPYRIIAANTARALTNAIPFVKGKKWTRDERKQFVKDRVESEFGIVFNNFDESDSALLCLAHLKDLRRSQNGDIKKVTRRNTKTVKKGS